MKLDLSTLNNPQREAVQTVAGPLMILAGAGTGKTSVISYRIANMIAQGIPAKNIAAVTFTNKASREMGERVRSIAGSAATKELRLGTFHSFCLGILRTFAKEAGLEQKFHLVGTSEQIDLVRRALEEKRWTGLYRAEDCHQEISKAKNQLLTPEDIRHQSYHAITRVIDAAVLSEVYTLYERQLKLNRVIDFDDCIFKTVTLLRDNEDVKKRLQEEHQYLLVDEYQDTNVAQLTILRELAGERHNICVVGDDDQSIYSWRGAVSEIMDEFKRYFPGTKVVFLEQNYRCTNVILNAANNVIRNNVKRMPKTLWSTKDAQTPIVLAALENEKEEARFIAERCLGLLGKGHRLRDVGILYRANAQAKAIEMALREHRLKYKTFGGTSFFERREVKDFLAYLRLITSPTDRIAFWRVVNTPPRGIGLRSLEKIEEHCKTSGLSPLEASTKDSVGLTAKVKQAMDAFVEAVRTMNAMSLETPEDLEAIGRAIIKDFGLEDEVKTSRDDAATRIRKLEILRSLPPWLKDAATGVVEAKGELDMRVLLDQLTLTENERSTENDKDGDFISLMTIHAAKGLEFPAVFVCGLEEDLLPHRNSAQDPVALTEERRLFYVAVTRAKDRLFLSRAKTRNSAYQSQDRMPSRFIAELPTDALELAEGAGGPVKDEAERKTQTVNRLSSLRDSLRKGFQS